jgi:predicted aspartyl protease
MGMTYLEIEIGNPANPSNTRKLDFLVDSGAIYTVAPSTVLAELRIEPISEEKYWLANGEKIARKRGIAFFRYGDKVGGADVVFGEEGDSNLLGATTLESLGLAFDPLRRELKPMPLIIGGYFPKWS